MNENITPIHKEQKVFNLEVKTTDDNEGIFEGYGSIFGNKDSYNDIIVKGAFNETLKSTNLKDIKLLWQHNTDEPIGIYEEIKEDDKGLYVRGRLLIKDIARAREAYALLKAGAINGLSIGFTIDSGGSEYDAKRNARILSKLSLWEISIVTFPANARAKVANVKCEDMTIRDFENFLRDAGGFSRADATAIALHGFKKGLQRDAEVSIESETKLVEDMNLILTALRNGVKRL